MPKRVLLVSRCAWTLDSFRGGLIEYLIAHGYEVHAAGNSDDGYSTAVENRGAVFHHLPVSKKGLNPIEDLRLLKALIVLCRSLRPSAIHCFTIKPVIYGPLAARLTSINKTFCTITGLGYTFTSAARPLLMLVSAMYKFALRYADVVFFQNPDDLKLFHEKRLLSADKSRLVPGSGVNTRYFAPEYRSDRSRGDESVRFLFVGRLLSDKGIYEYLDAAESVKSRIPGAEFQILGGLDPGNPTCLRQGEIEQAVAAGIVIWHGRSDDVRSYLAEVDVVVLPSYREGTPRALLEAAAMGLPIVATDVPGCREVVDNLETGLLVPARNSFALAEALADLALDSAKRVKFGNAGRLKMLREYDEKIVFDETLIAYNDQQN